MIFYPMIYIAFHVLSTFIFFASKPTSTFNSLIHLRTPSVVLYRFFSLFFSKFVCRLTYISTLISCLFLGGKYFKSMFCRHIIHQQWVKVKNLWDFLDFSLDSMSNIRTRVISEPLVSNTEQNYGGWELTTLTNQLNCNPQ